MLTTELEVLEHGRRLRVARLGTGPPLLLLHGYPDNLQIYSRLAPLLAERFTVVAFDWPGMGGSDAWPGGASPHQMAERLLALMDRWGMARADVLGMDMGGQPALLAAARWPDRIAHLAVLNSLAIWDGATSWEIRLLRQRGWNLFLIEHFPRLVFERAVRTSLERGRPLAPDLRRDLWARFRRREVRAFVSRMCSGYQGALPKLAEHYAAIRCPTLLLWGERDRHFPLQQGEGLHARVPRSRFEVIADGPHWMVYTRAEEVAERYLQFASAANEPPGGGP